MARAKALEDVRLADLLTLLAVARRGSITGAARELDVTPSQVSKAMTRLEAQLGVSLFTRGARRIAMTDAYQRIAPRVEALVEDWKQLRSAETDPRPEFTIAAPSYLNLRFFPAIARKLTGVRLRALEMPPSMVRAFVTENVFDVALTLGAERLPNSWVNVRAGEVRKTLYASPTVAKRLGAQPIDAHKLSAIPFVSPVYNANGRLLPTDDGCPLGRGDRVLGHEVETIGLAIEVAARTDQLVFGPAIAAAPLVAAGALVEIRVNGWKSSESLFVACNGDRMLHRTQGAILAAVRGALDP